MELRIFFSIFLSALAFLAIGSFAYYKPSCFGGTFKLVRTSKFLSIKHRISTNDFVIKNTKIVGAGILIAGFLAIVFAVTYLFYPEILSIFRQNLGALPQTPANPLRRG